MEQVGTEVGIRGGGTYEIRDRAGNLKASGRWRNAATTVGRNLMLNAMFRGTTPSTTWYVGLIDNSPAPSLAAADTMASHAGWAESTVYGNAGRPAWAPGAAASSVLSAAATAHAINGSATIYGFFITDVNTKGGATGNLWATGAFDTPQAVVNTDTITGTYETELQAVA